MALFIEYDQSGDDYQTTVHGAEWLKTVIITMNSSEADGETFIEEFKRIHSEQEASRRYDHGPIFDLFLKNASGLLAAEAPTTPDKIESFFALMLDMLQKIEEPDHLKKAITNLCELFSASPEGHPELRLRLLMMLYNTFSDPGMEGRYRVFKYILDYAATANLFDQVAPYIEHLESWMEDWDEMKPETGKDDKRQLYFDISTYMRKMGKRIEAFQHLKKYHGLFKADEDAKELGKPDIVKRTQLLLTDAIQLPSVIQFDDILALDTVQALKKSKQDELVTLCTIFLSGSVNDLRDFQKKNPKVFEQYDLSFTDAMSKIRLLTLATLAHGRSEISLAEVATALEESEDNVERWVVRAISEGVIDGRIDQLNHKVLVKSSYQRKFEKDEWAFLDSKLNSWIENLESVIKFIGEQKQLKDPLLIA